MAKKPETNRRALIEQQRKKARAKERRATLLTVIVASVVGIAIIGGAVYFAQKEKGPRGPLRDVGLATEAAGCDPIKKEPQKAGTKNSHVTEAVPYAAPIPPTGGNHHPNQLPGGSKKFYSRDENPPPERAVHSLEHGYVVVWYDKQATAEQVSLLERAGRAARGKILIVPWTRDDFADGKHIAMTSWEVRRHCGEVSGAAIQDFYDAHGAQKSTAPEKNVL